MLYTKLDCQKGFNSIPFLYKTLGSGLGSDGANAVEDRVASATALFRWHLYMKRLSISNFLAVKFTKRFLNITSKDHAAQ